MIITTSVSSGEKLENRFATVCTGSYIIHTTTSTTNILLSLPDAGVKAPSPNPAYHLTPPAFSVVLDFLSINLCFFSFSSSLLFSLSHSLCLFNHNNRLSHRML